MNQKSNCGSLGTSGGEVIKVDSDGTYEGQLFQGIALVRLDRFLHTPMIAHKLLFVAGLYNNGLTL